MKIKEQQQQQKQYLRRAASPLISLVHAAYCSLFSGSIILCVNWECLALIRINTCVRLLLCVCVPRIKLHIYEIMWNNSRNGSFVFNSILFLFICTWRSNLQLFAFVTEFDTFLRLCEFLSLSLSLLIFANLYTSFMNFLCVSFWFSARTGTLTHIFFSFFRLFCFRQTAFRKFRNLTHICDGVDKGIIDAR